jgi:hypothetical protein
MDTVTRIPRREGTTLITIGDLVREVVREILCAYAHNRGSVSYDRGFVETIARNLNLRAFGIVTYGMYHGVLTLLDAHHRVEALRWGVEMGILKGSILNKLIVIKNVGDISAVEFLRTHSTIGTHRNHSKYQSVTNPDYRFGDYIFNKIKTELISLGYPPEVVTWFLGGKRASTLAYIIALLEEKTPEENLCNAAVVAVRKGARGNFSTPTLESKVELTNRSHKRLMGALIYYLDYLNALEIESKTGPRCNALIRSAAVFGFFVISLLSKETRITKTAPDLARKAYKREHDLCRLSNILGRGDSASNVQLEAEIWKLLGLNKRAVSEVEAYTPYSLGELLPHTEEKVQPFEPRIVKAS